MVQLVPLDYIGLVVIKIICILVIGVWAKSHIGATLLFLDLSLSYLLKDGANDN